MQNFDLGIFLLAALPVLLSITVREVARGYTARYWGDHTAEQYGRLTFNPLPHIDIIGTIIVPLASLMLTGFLFGWAKPAPIDSRNLRNPRKAWRSIAAVGPVCNLLLAFAWGIIMSSASLAPQAYQYPLAQMAGYGIQINALLFALNLLPLLPWDGGILIDTFLPPHLSQKFRRIEPYGVWIILALMVTGLLGKFIMPLVNSVLMAVLLLTGSL